MLVARTVGDVLCARDGVWFVLQPEGGSSEQEQEAEMRQGVGDKLSGGAAEGIAKLEQREQINWIVF